MAGALGLRLAGPRVYGGVEVDDHWMGDGRAEATPEDIDRALTIYRTAFVGTLMIVAAIVFLVLALPRPRTPDWAKIEELVGIQLNKALQAGSGGGDALVEITMDDRPDMALGARGPFLIEAV